MPDETLPDDTLPDETLPDDIISDQTQRNDVAPGDPAPSKPVIVPPDALSPQTLAALIEEFITRDGAVHGHRDDSMPHQIAAVTKLLNLGNAVIVFDEADERCTIMLKENLKGH